MRRITSSLRVFLDRPDRPDDALGYQETHGFLFAVTCAPELVPPSEWTPIILGEEGPGFGTLKEAQTILGELMELYNTINAGVVDRSARPSPPFAFRDDVLSNLEDDAPIARWARGFLCGHQWLEEVWDELVPEDLKDPLASTFLVLSFFASRQLVEACAKELTEPSRSVEDLAKTMRELFPDAMYEYASLGRSIYEVLARVDEQVDDAATAPKVGRNEPCPCGSGRKYKRCHGGGGSAT